LDDEGAKVGESDWRESEECLGDDEDEEVERDVDLVVVDEEEEEGVIEDLSPMTFLKNSV